MSGPRLVAEFATPADYLAAHDEEVVAGGLFLRGAELPAGSPASGCTLLVRIAGQDQAELPATIASVAPGAGVSVIFLAEPAALHQLAARLRAPAAKQQPDHAGHEPLSLAERVRLALSGDREVRIQLLRAPNKQLHATVLRNPRISLEEVQWAARQPALAPDALQQIGEHPQWGHNAVVATALVRNPKTPLPVALRLLSRLPDSELRLIAKGNARPQVVAAARKMVIG